MPQSRMIVSTRLLTHKSNAFMRSWRRLKPVAPAESSRHSSSSACMNVPYTRPGGVKRRIKRTGKNGIIPLYVRGLTAPNTHHHTTTSFPTSSDDTNTNSNNNNNIAQSSVQAALLKMMEILNNKRDHLPPLQSNSVVLSYPFDLSIQIGGTITTAGISDGHHDTDTVDLSSQGDQGVADWGLQTLKKIIKNGPPMLMKT